MATEPKNVEIEITSLQIAEDQEQETKLQIKGQLYEKNGIRYLIYEEKDEDDTIVRNRLTIKENSFYLKKTGAVKWDMRFERGIKNAGVYQTPFGTIPITVLTNELLREETKDRISLQLEYILEMQETYQAKCTMTIDIRTEI